ncbi:hypothetical protein [Amycolatopsis magusensis]|uniref:hypothetical protein n=1 Tax=Amycolatopsis magusensis TaxID=882444 RepID=UPI0037BA2066
MEQDAFLRIEHSDRDTALIAGRAACGNQPMPDFCAQDLGWLLSRSRQFVDDAQAAYCPE